MTTTLLPVAGAHLTTFPSVIHAQFEATIAALSFNEHLAAAILEQRDRLPRAYRSRTIPRLRVAVLDASEAEHPQSTAPARSSAAAG